VTEVRAGLAGRSRSSFAIYAGFRVAVHLLCRIWFRISVEGREHLPTSGAFIVAPVHRSNLDTPFAACLTNRRLRFMGKDSLWKVRQTAWLLTALGGFPVTRGTADREALKRCMEVLDAGEPLVIFPEGERKSGPLVQPLFDGAAYLAVKCQVPVVPVGIGGSERAMPKGSKMIWPRKVHMIIGPPMQPAPSENGRAPRKAVGEMSDLLHQRLQVLFDAAQIRAGA
jgi:1-acyl-sn-glycerol-3-phosphate acyltransferase